MLTLRLLASALVLSLPAAAQLTFVNVGPQKGLNTHTYINTNNHSLGVNWVDVDNDGWVDLFAVNGFGAPAHLYLNQGGTFVDGDHLLPPLPDRNMTQSIFGDYDNDGDDDIYICVDNESWLGIGGPNVPDGPPNILLKNYFVENGNRVLPGVPLFRDVAISAGVQVLADPPLSGPTGYPGYRSFTAGWIDFDGDGFLDLYVGNLARLEHDDPGNPNFFYRNQGDGTFNDVTANTGMESLGTDLWRPSLAMVTAHLDSDNLPDMYVVNNGKIATTVHHDYLWKNTGLGFVETTVLSPGMGDDSLNGMGVDVADLDRNGTWDLYITDNDAGFGTDDGNVLYLGNGDGTFQDNSADPAGVHADNSWGCNFFDADHDGWEDLYVAHMNDQDFMYRNNADGTFEDVSVASGMLPFPFSSGARGSAQCDYDKDGDQDIAVLVDWQGIVLLENQTPDQGNWLKVRLTGTTSNRNAIGTIVKIRYVDLEAGGSQTQMRQVKGAMSGHGQDDWVVHFGVGSATKIREVRVIWPTGERTLLLQQDANQLLEIVEP